MISSSQRPLPDNTRHSQQINIHAPAGFEPVISASEWPQTDALDRAASGTGKRKSTFTKDGAFKLYVRVRQTDIRYSVCLISCLVPHDSRPLCYAALWTALILLQLAYLSVRRLMSVCLSNVMFLTLDHKVTSPLRQTVSPRPNSGLDRRNVSPSSLHDKMRCRTDLTWPKVMTANIERLYLRDAQIPCVRWSRRLLMFACAQWGQ